MSNYLFFSLNIIFLFNTFALGTTFEERFKCTSWSSKNISAPKAWSISYLSVPPRKNASSTLTPQRLKVLISAILIVGISELSRIIISKSLDNLLKTQKNITINLSFKDILNYEFIDYLLNFRT